MSYQWAATVTLLSRLHEAISTHRRVQKLKGRRPELIFRATKRTDATKIRMDEHWSMYASVTYLQRFVEQTRSSSAVQKVVVLLHVAFGEPLGQVETVQDNRSTLFCYRGYSTYSIFREYRYRRGFVPQTQITGRNTGKSIVLKISAHI